MAERVMETGGRFEREAAAGGIYQESRQSLGSRDRLGSQAAGADLGESVRNLAERELVIGGEGSTAIGASCRRCSRPGPPVTCSGPPNPTKC